MNKLKEKFFLLKLRTSKDPEAFGKLYDLYVDKIYRFISFKVSRKEEVEDLTAEVFLKTWQYINEVGAETIDNLRAFLYQTARNAVIDFYRGKAQRELTGRENFKDNIKDESQDLFIKTQVKSEVEEIKKALGELKEEYREVIILRLIEEMSVGEVAQVLGKSKGAVRILLHRAIKTLRGIIKQEKFTVPRNKQKRFKI